MKPELVGKVRRDLQSAWTDSKDPDDGWWDFMARYAIALAERAADEAVSAYRRGEDGVLTVAIERAVEGA